MAYNMKRGNSAVPFKELGSSPAKQKEFDIKSEKSKNIRDWTKGTGKHKKYPKNYTEEDKKFLEEQHEDIVRPEDKS